MSEYGIYSPSKGYLQVVGSRPNLEEFGDDFIDVPLRPSTNHVWQDNSWVYVPPLPPTPEQIRANMPHLTPREFRDILIDEGILTDAEPDEVTLAIQQIPFDKERTKALNAWQNSTMFIRSDPYIDMIGAMFGLTPEDIDVLWMSDNENNS